MALRSDLDWFAASLVRAVAVDPVDHSTVFAGGVMGDHAMARSTDGGLHWSFMSSAGLFNPGDIEVSAVDHDYVWASGPNDAVWKSSNGGDTCHKKSSGITDTFVTEIALSPSSTDIAYAACGISGGVFKTTDGGASWTQKNNGLTNHAVNAIVVDPDDKKHVLVGTISSGVFESTDGGSSWTPKNVGLPSNADVTALAFNPTDTQNVLVGLAGTGVYASSNGSDTWSNLNTGLPAGASRFIQDIAMSADGLVLYAGTSTGVYRLDA